MQLLYMDGQVDVEMESSQTDEPISQVNILWISMRVQSLTCKW